MIFKVAKMPVAINFGVLKSVGEKWQNGAYRRAPRSVVRS